MRAIGAGARGDFSPPVEKKGNAAPLRDCRHGLGAADERALVGVFQVKKHGGDVAGVEHGCEFVGERAGLAERRREQIEAGAHSRPRGAEEGLVIMLVIPEAE
jgi:hypothetical protein